MSIRSAFALRALKTLRPVLLAGVSIVLTLQLPAPSRGEEPAPAARSAPKLDIYGDPLPAGAVARLGSIRLRHGGVDSSAFSPASDQLYTHGFLHEEIRVWGVPSGRLLDTLVRDESMPCGLTLSGDGATLVVPWLAVVDDKLSLVLSQYETGTLKPLREVNAGAVELSDFIRIRGLLLCNSDRWLMLADRKPALRIYDLETGKAVGEHPNRSLVGYSCDTETIVVQHKEGQTLHISLVDAKTGEARSEWSLKRDGYSLHPMALSDDGQRIAVQFVTGDFFEGESHLRIFDAHTGGELGVVKGRWWHFDHERRVLLTSEENASLWDVAELPEIDFPFFPPGDYTPRNFLRISPDRRWVLCSTGATLELWDRRTWQRTLEGHAIDRIGHVAVSPTGELAATVAQGSTVQIWRLPEGTPVARHTFETLRNPGVAFTADGEHLISLEARKTELVPEDMPPLLAGTPRKDGPTVVRIRDALTGTVLREFDAPSEPTQFAYAPVTNRVAIGNRSVVTVLDLKEGGIVATIGDESATSIGQFVFSPKGDILVIDAARRIEAWDLDAVAKLYELPGGIPSRTEFAFSHTGHLLLTSAQDNTRKSVTVVIYEVASGVAARKFVIPESGRSAELFAPRVAKVVTLNSPRPVQLPLRGKAFQFRIWDISSQDIHAAPFPIWNGRWVCAATVDGALLLTSDDSVTVWPTPRDILRSGTSSQSFTDRELEDLWIGLADEPSAALSAIYSLAQGGDDVVGFLHRKLPPAPPLDRSIIRKQIQALDSDRFVERQSAKAELMKIRVEAEPYLRAAETDAANLEIRRSIQEILRSPPDVLGKNQDEITAIRAIHVLELIGSTRAKELLKHVAGGAALHRRTEYAKRSIDWLESVDPR